MRNLTKKYADACLLFLIGLAVGWAVSSSSSSRATVVRQGTHEFINPLLECEIGEELITKELKNFRSSVESLIAEKTESGDITDVSVYFRDLNNGPWFGINEKEVFSPASLLKTVFMVAALKQMESDPDFLYKEAVFLNQKPDNTDPFFKPSQVLEVGHSYKIDDLIQRMIVYSDNNAKDLLLSNMDEKILDKTLDELGLTRPDPNRTGDFMNIKNYATIFRVLYNASYLNQDISNKALGLLSMTEFKQGLVAGVPDNVKVAHKFGERTFKNHKQLHDCGIVYHPKRPYLACVMTHGDDFNKLAKAIADISYLLYSEVSKQF